jgi:hypothetical protein
MTVNPGDVLFTFNVDPRRRRIDPAAVRRLELNIEHIGDGIIWARRFQTPAEVWRARY